MVIVDSGFWLAIMDSSDRFHKISVKHLEAVNEPLITTCAVITETTHLLLSRIGWPAALRFIDSLDNGVSGVFSIGVDHMSQVAKLMRKYRDLPMDFADASLVILAEHLGHGRILSTDKRDFKTYRWKERKPFVNLLVMPD